MIPIPHRIGRMLQTSPREPSTTERLPRTVRLRGTIPLRVILTMVPMVDLQEDHHIVVAVVAAVTLLVDQGMVSGKMASTFQALPMHALSVSFSVPPTILRNYRLASISRTTTISLWRHLAMMFRSPRSNSPTLR